MLTIKSIVLTLICCVISINGQVEQYPTVKTAAGKIQGRLVQTKSGVQGYAYQGVPYVEPPLGPLRFAKPVPKWPWNGTLICHDYKPACPQNTSTSQTQFEHKDEDCLYMNVFVGLQCNQDHPCPVVYYVHGGGYEFDAPPMFDPDVLVENFASKSIVYVTVAYRLGVLGFWSTGTDEALGNWAMHDMVEGARWIQREIKYFGGDRTRVTIMGHSSSAMAVSLLTITPKTTGLFDQAVIMSGTSCVDYAMSNDISNYQKLAVKMNCASEQDWTRKRPRYKKIIDCMRSIDAQVLVNEFNEVRNGGSDDNANQMTVPRNDGPSGLFPNPLEQMIAERRPLRTMTGTTKYETSGGVKDLLINATALTAVGMCDVLIEDMHLERDVARRAEKACINEYVFKACPNNRSFDGPYSYWATRTAGMMDDKRWFAPCHKEVMSLVSKRSQVYLYSFDFEKTGMEGQTPYHSFDLLYINGLHKDRFTFDDRDRQIQSLYLPLFVNFVKYGDPTPNPAPEIDTTINNITFEPVGSRRNGFYNYLSVDIPMSMKPDYHKSAVILWNHKIPNIIEKGNAYLGSSGYESRMQQADIGPSSSISRTGLSLLIAGCLTVIGLGTVILVVRRPHKSRRDIDDEKRNTINESMKNLRHYDTFNSENV